MDADPINRIDPGKRSWSMDPDDMPHPIRVRYLKDHRGGFGLGYFLDATSPTAAFRDMGDRLSTGRNDPNVIRDLIAIAHHRGWTTIHVRGETPFRREVWIAARAAGLEVRGYRATDRDLQDLARRAERTRDRVADQRETPAAAQPSSSRRLSERLKVVEAVVRNRIVEPAIQGRILATARARIAEWLERGATFDPPNQPRRDRDR